MPFEFRSGSLGGDFVSRVNRFGRELAGQENRRFRNSKIGGPLSRFVHAPQERGIFFWREISVEFRAERRLHLLDQEFSRAHDWFAIEPNVKITTDAVDVGLGFPIGASVLGIRVAKSDVNPWNFLVLQDIAD